MTLVRRLALLLLTLTLVGCPGSIVEYPRDDDTAGDDDDAPAVSTIAGSPGGAGLADGVGNDAYFFHPYGIDRDGDVVYVADGWGQTIRRVDTVTREVTTVAGTPGVAGLVDSVEGAPLFDYPCGLEMGPDGLLYVADRKNGRIRIVDPDTGEVDSLRDQGGIVSSAEPFDVAFDDDGNLFFSDLLACQIRWVHPVSGASGVVIGDNGDCHSTDGPVLQARIGEPRGLEWVDGLLYFSDRVGESVRALDTDTGIVFTAFGSVGDGDDGFEDGVALDARFHKPTGMAAHDGVLYVTDSDNDAIRAVDLADGSVTTLAGVGVNGNRDGPGEQATFSWPVDVVVDSGGDLLVVDPGGHCIRRVDLASTEHTVTTLAGAIGNSGAGDGVGTAARMSEPRGLTRGEDDVVWLVDTYNTIVRTFDPVTLDVATVAGDAEHYDHQDGVGADAHFMTPSAAAWYDGRLFITEMNAHTIRVLDAATAEVTTLAGLAPEPGFVDGPGADARFFLPADVAVVGDGPLYVLENGNRAIRLLDPDTGETQTFVGPEDPGNLLAGPEGMTWDGADTLYVTDYAACTLVGVDVTTGAMELKAGGPFECEEADGVGDQARFRRPAGLDVDPDTGIVYVACVDGHTVRAYDPSTGEVTTVVGDPDVMAPVDGSLQDASFSTPVDVLVVDGGLLVLDRFSAHLRMVRLP